MKPWGLPSICDYKLEAIEEIRMNMIIRDLTYLCTGNLSLIKDPFNMKTFAHFHAPPLEISLVQFVFHLSPGIIRESSKLNLACKRLPSSSGSSGSIDRGDDDEELVLDVLVVDLEVACDDNGGSCCWMGATGFVVAPVDNCAVRLSSPLLLLHRRLEEEGMGDEYRPFFRSIVGGGVFGLFRSMLCGEARTTAPSSSSLKAPSGKSQYDTLRIGIRGGRTIRS